MATISPTDPILDVREQIARIDKMQTELAKIQVEIVKVGADTDRTRQEMKFAPLTLIFTGMGAAAAFFAAGVAFAKLFVG